MSVGWVLGEKWFFRAVGNLAVAEKQMSGLAATFHIDSLTDWQTPTRCFGSQTNLLRHPPGAGRKLNWIYGPSQICPIDFSRHLHRKYLSEAQKRGLNFLHGHNHLSWSPAAVAASVFGFLSKSCMTDAGRRDGRRPKIGSTNGILRLEQRRTLVSVVSQLGWICSSVKAQIDFCLLLCTFTMEFILKW